MTSQLVRQELGRPKLEALAFAHATAARALGDPSIAALFLEALDPERISHALRELLEQLSSCESLGDVTCHSKAQDAISTRAGELPLKELYGLEAWALDTLVALCNQLPPVRAIPEPAWQRQLAEGLST